MRFISKTWLTMNGKDCEFCRSVKKEEAVSCAFVDERTMAFLVLDLQAKDTPLLFPRRIMKPFMTFPRTKSLIFSET